MREVRSNVTDHGSNQNAQKRFRGTTDNDRGKTFAPKFLFSPALKNLRVRIRMLLFQDAPSRLRSFYRLRTKEIREKECKGGFARTIWAGKCPGSLAFVAHHRPTETKQEVLCS